MVKLCRILTNCIIYDIILNRINLSLSNGTRNCRRLHKESGGIWMIEADVHRLIMEDSRIRNSILSLLKVNYEDENIEFVHEDQYPNGMYADFTIKKNNYVVAIMECKGSDIGVNDYVRGIGQILEYQHFADNKMSMKGYDFTDNACSIYFLPSSVLRNRNFNVGLFKYPEKSKIIELNEHNKNVRLISEKELQELATAVDNDLVTISQYYIRDNRLYELYICLKYCQFNKIRGVEKIDRGRAEKNFLRQLETPNNRNWRNAFIALSSLGLIDNNNLPTFTGSMYASGDYSEFCLEMYKSYIKEYVDLLTQVLLKKSKNEMNRMFEISYKDLSVDIGKMFANKKVLFVTDSDNRYLSSWLNIMRDDFLCIDFAPRNNTRKINYNIGELNDSAILNRLRNNQTAYAYIEKLNSLLK